VKQIYELMKSKLPSDVKFKQLAVIKKNLLLVCLSHSAFLQGGYFFWVELPDAAQGVRVAQIAREKYKVIVLPGGRASATGGYQNCVRISFSFNERGVVLDGISKVCNAINEHLAELKQ
jgi:DNA-binding transcriptional MocR family regulator